MLRLNDKDRQTLVDPLFRTSWRFWMLVSVLSTLVGWGIYMYSRQLRFGLGETGMQRPTYWGVYMVNFVFFIGISHAGTLISAILRITQAEWRRPITRVAEAITAIALVVGTLQIIIDMGRPERLAYIYRYGRLQSPILWDVVSVTIYFLCSVTYLYLPLIPDAAILRDNMPPGVPAWRRVLYRTLALGWRGTIEQWHRLERAISFMAVFIVPVAVSVHTIISWILATTVQPGWHSTIFGPYFVVGAIFSGIGALFLAMTAVRQVLGLEEYIQLTQYRYLGLLFITMNMIWAYFTYTENMILAAGQQMMEFPVLASKLWGEFAFSFWMMITLMIAAFVLQVLPMLIPSFLKRRLALGIPSIFVLIFTCFVLVLLLLDDQLAVQIASVDQPNLRTVGWIVAAFIAIRAILSIGIWFKDHLIATSVIAGMAVLAGMWLERWVLIVPTLTHPRLIAYSTYTPTIMEFALTTASIALFCLLFVIFFKLFPAVSIWEVAEGRVVQDAYEQVSIPAPEPVVPVRKQPRWRFR